MHPPFSRSSFEPTWEISLGGAFYLLRGFGCYARPNAHMSTVQLHHANSEQGSGKGVLNDQCIRRASCGITKSAYRVCERY